MHQNEMIVLRHQVGITLWMLLCSSWLVKDFHGCAHGIGNQVPRCAIITYASNGDDTTMHQIAVI